MLMMHRGDSNKPIADEKVQEEVTPTIKSMTEAAPSGLALEEPSPWSLA